MKNAAQKIQAYLCEVLGTSTALRTWPGAAAVPFFLTDRFDLFEVTLLDRPVVIALDKTPGTLSPSELAARLETLRTKAELVVYAAERLSFRERRALIQYKVPFVVPGNQLYLPPLGLDLREYLPRRAGDGKVATLKPSAQALLICGLLARPWNREVFPAKIARDLDYTVMTASRAANEIAAVGLADVSHKPQRGNPLYLVFKAPNPTEVWRHAEPVVTSPVIRKVWVDQLPEGLNARVAGADSLARHTMLTPPAHRVYAVKREDWVAARKTHPALEDLGKDANRIELEIWSYSPSLAPGAEVDPYSLIASMRDDADERVQQALDELREGVKW